MTNSVKKNIHTSLKFVYSDNNSLSVIFHDNDLLLGVVGEFNKNLKELEKITLSNIYSRGNSILIKSTPEKNEVLKNAIQFLANQFINNGSIEQKDILSSVDQFMINEKVKNTNVTDIIKTPKKSIIPRSEKQKELFKNQLNKNKSLENQTIEVLVENQTKDNVGLFGRSEHMTSVIFNGSLDDVGKVIKVKVNKSNQNTLFGENMSKSELRVA